RRGGSPVWASGSRSPEGAILCRGAAPATLGEGVKNQAGDEKPEGAHENLDEELGLVRRVGGRDEGEHDRDEGREEAEAVPEKASASSSGNRNGSGLPRDLLPQAEGGREHVEVGKEVHDQRRVDELEIRVLDRRSLSGGEDEDGGEDGLEDHRE